jgi:hypothetical protein
MMSAGDIKRHVIRLCVGATFAVLPAQAKKSIIGVNVAAVDAGCALQRRAGASLTEIIASKCAVDTHR